MGICYSTLIIDDIKGFENDFEQPLKVYNRRAKKPTDFTNMLMFDGENLRVGFTGEIIK